MRALRRGVGPKGVGIDGPVDRIEERGVAGVELAGEVERAREQVGRSASVSRRGLAALPTQRMQRKFEGTTRMPGYVMSTLWG